MNLRQSLYAHLTGKTTDATDAQDTAIASLTAYVSTRIYPLTAPEGAICPMIVSQWIVNPIDNTMGTTGTAKHPSIQFKTMHPNSDTAWAVSDLLVTALKDYSGTMGGEGGVAIDRVICINRGIELVDSQAVGKLSNGTIKSPVVLVITEFEFWESEA